MKTVYCHNIEPRENLENLLKKKGLVSATEINKADIILYGGSLKDLMLKLAYINPSEIRLKTMVPFSRFLAEGASPPALEGYEAIVNCSFDQEAIRGVSDKIEELFSVIDSKKAFGDLSRFMKSNAIELIQNALIHKKTSGGAGRVRLELFEASAFYGIQVSDSFGALSPSKVLEKIGRVYRDGNYEEKTTGAGLGLYMVLNASDSVIIDIKKKKHSKVCCIIHKYKRLRDFKRKSPALYFLNS